MESMLSTSSAAEATATESSHADDAMEASTSLPSSQTSIITSTTPGMTENKESSQTLPAQEPTVPNQKQPPNERPFDTGNRQILVHGVKKVKKENAQTVSNNWLQLAREKHDIIPKDGSIEKVKKPPFGNWMVITVSDETMVQPMMDFINSGVITFGGNEQIRAQPATSNQGKRKERNDDNLDANDAKRARNEPDVVFISEEHLRNKVTPLWKLSKEEQQDTKVKKMIRMCAMKIVQGVNSRIRSLDRNANRDRSRDKQQTPFDWLKKKPAIHIEPIVSAPSPLRNKWELTFGFKVLSEDPDAKRVPAVGFKPCGWAGGVAFSEKLEIVSPELARLVEIFNRFLLDCPLSPYDSRTHTGFWRQVTIRISQRTRECMLIICHGSAKNIERVNDSSETSKMEDVMVVEKNKLVEILKDANLTNDVSEEPFRVTSLYFQEYEGASNPSIDDPVQHVYGKTVLTECLGKCNFEISPGAFFQVNTPGAELLYGIAIEKVREVAKDPEKTLLFDVCCGTGTIGLTCLKEGVVGKIVGVDISKPAIDNAKRNAELNGLADGSASKARFVADRAENVLQHEIDKNLGLGLDFVALVDPARGGLHGNVVRTLRATEAIRRIVYVSCNPTGSLVTDAALFCSPQTNKYKGTPFTIVSASPVDMFPLTDHCEIVMVFERMEPVSSVVESTSTA